MMASHAWYQGFAAAAAKVVVSDGSSAIERVQERHFSHYTSVLDLMHALSYALAAARAATRTAEQAHRLYTRWAEFICKGKVELVINELDEIQQCLGMPAEDASAEDPQELVRRTFVFYTNHKHRMNYPEYRRQGFPLTSSVMESSVKQMHRRVKGSEKFWSNVDGEAILTMRGDYLSDNHPLETYWKVAQSDATGERRYRQTL